ncbi:MAG: sigma-70 family RNA polymerase sigma factor [Armatimonadetes bacterium]|jgi:RNA polymerase sigma-70 factor (ECF subfamily)|nr:sigma-70 family RNA polymerase sigma factor [Armatimonadota bacterium]
MQLDNDAELMQRVAEGDESHFQDLFDRHYDRAVAIAYRSLGDLDAAEDIAMEGFARIYEARRSYAPTARFTTFLFRVIVNLCMNAAKRRRIVTFETLDESQSAARDSDPAATAQRKELCDEVRAAVLSLPPNQRMALALTRYEHMSYAESAEVMNISLKALESLLHRAKENLRKKLRHVVE